MTYQATKQEDRFYCRLHMVELTKAHPNKGTATCMHQKFRGGEDLWILHLSKNRKSYSMKHLHLLNRKYIYVSCVHVK